MEPAKLLKAMKLKVYPNADKVSWRVPGQTDIYLITFSAWSGELQCGCKASSFGTECSHILAVKHYISKQKAA